MKTPITYYGGKQTMLKHLLVMIPEHRIYCEPFFGGGALFFAKPKAEVEVINDVNGEVINFFKVLKTKFPALQKEIQATLHSRELYKKSMQIYNNPKSYSDIQRAWALWTATNQGFAGMIGSWGFGKTNSKEKAVAAKRDNFIKTYEDRLRMVQVENTDALKVIARCNEKDAFLYCDPPYIGSDQGHYSGYTESEYKTLLDALSKYKGKFLLSSYPSKILSEYIRKQGWRKKEIEKYVAVTKHTDKKKTEVLVFNYDPAKMKPMQSKQQDVIEVEEVMHELSGVKSEGEKILKSLRDPLFLSDLPFKSKVDRLALDSAMDYLAIWKMNGMRDEILPDSLVFYNPVKAVLGDDTLDIYSVKDILIKKYFLLEELDPYFKKHFNANTYQFKVVTNPRQYLPDNLPNPQEKMTSKKNPYSDIDKECQLIERFIGFHDQILNKYAFGYLLDEFQKAIEDKKITKKSPVAKEIMEIQHVLVKQFNTMKYSAHFLLKPATIKRLKAIVVKWQNSLEQTDEKFVSSKRQKKDLQGLNGVQAVNIMPSTEFASLRFNTIGFQDPWRNFIGDPAPGFTAMVFGMPKMGKSYLCLDFAGYLARTHGKVLYVAKEEKLDMTLQNKVNEKNVSHDNLTVADGIPADLSPYDFIFLDSVNKLGLTSKDLDKLKADNKGKSFIYVFQATKSGKFKGNNEFQHDVDVVIEVPERGKAVQYGRFNQGGDIDIFPDALPIAA